LITLVIPARPGQVKIRAVEAARTLDYPADRLRLIVARGRQPAAQRNAAVKAASGELIYFLDDDAVVQPGNLREIVAHFKQPNVQMVGGPNLCPPGAPFLERVFSVVQGSWLAFGPSRARYDAVGKVRATSEKELILCNLAARRQTLLEAGGFDEALYPNEENALMDAVRERGGVLLYDPGLVVFRRPRATLAAFYRMLLSYGRGRAEQFRLHPTPGSALNFVPPMFCVYLLGLLVLGAVSVDLPQWLKVAVTTPLVVYAGVLVVQTVFSAIFKGLLHGLFAMPLLVMSHLLYGLGFWRGLFTRLRSGSAGTRPKTEVALETVPL
jgi:cellulose synthase/poly-beta-1,6-N-acetylglucosamine synthase-like glycosyltransferase